MRGGGSKLWALVSWTIESPHTKYWPPTMPRTLQKVSGGWWVGVWVVVLTANLVFCFGPKLWFWPRPKLNNYREKATDVKEQTASKI